MEKQKIFVLISICLVIQWKPQAECTDEKGFVDRLMTPLSNLRLSQFQPSFPIYSKTLERVIVEKTNIKLTEVIQAYNINGSLENIMRNTALKELLSCFPMMSIQKTIDENIRILMTSFPPSAEFVAKKINRIEQQGLLYILANISVNITNPDTNGLQFCKIINRFISEQSNENTILRAEANKLNQSMKVFLRTFESMELNQKYLTNYLKSWYTSNNFGEASWRFALNNDILTNLRKVLVGNIAKSDLSKPFFPFLQNKYNLSQVDLDNVMLNYLGLSSNVINIMKYVPIDKLMRGHENTLADIYFTIPTFGHLLRHAFNSMTPIIGLVGAQFSGIEEILNKTPVDLFTFATPVSKILFNSYFQLEFGAETIWLINNKTMENLRNSHFNGISANRLILLTFKDFVNNLKNSSNTEKVHNHSRNGLKFLINKASLLGLYSIYKISSTYNTQPVQVLISKYITGDDKTLEKDLNFTAATRHFFREFNIFQIAVKTNLPVKSRAATFGQYGAMIEKKFGAAVRNALLEMQFTKVLPLFCNMDYKEFESTRIGDITKQCGDLDIGDKNTNLDVKGDSASNLMLLSNYTPKALLQGSGIALNISKQLSLRELAIYVRSHVEFSLLLPKKLKEIITSNNNFTEFKNMTINNVPEFGVFTPSFANAIKTGYNIFTSGNITLSALAARSNIEYSQLFELSLQQLLQLLRYLEEPNFKAFLDFNTIRQLCDTEPGTIKEIGQRCKLNASNPYVVIVNAEVLLNYTVKEIKQIAAVGNKPSESREVNLRDLFSYIVEGFAGLRRIQHMTRIPLIILTKQGNVTLQELENQPFTQTLTSMLGIDYSVIKKMFKKIPDNIMNLVKITPFKNLTQYEDGLDNVRQLYTGSIDTIVRSIISGNSGRFSVNQELPKYVKIIAKKKFAELFILYEVTESDVLDPTKYQDLMAIGFLFFGIHTDSFFEASFGISSKQLLRVKGKSASAIFDLYKHKRMKKKIDSDLGEISLIDLVKFIADGDLSYSESMLEFILTPIAKWNVTNTPTLNSTIYSILKDANFFQDIVDPEKLLIELCDSIFHKDTYALSSSEVTRHVLYRNVSSLMGDLERTEEQLLNLNVYTLLKVTYRYLHYIYFFVTPWAQLKEPDTQPFIEMSKLKFNTTELPPAFNHLKNLTYFQFVFNQTFDWYVGIYRFDKNRTANRKNILEIMSETVTDLSILEDRFSNTSIVELMTQLNITRRNLSSSTVSQLVKKTTKFDLVHLQNTPFFQNTNESVLRQLSKIPLSKLKFLKSTKGEVFNVSSAILVTFTFRELFHFFNGKLELEEMNRKVEATTNDFLNNRSLKAIAEMYSIDKDEYLDSSTVKFLLDTLELTDEEDELLSDLSLNGQRMLKRIKLRDWFVLFSIHHDERFSASLTWNILKHATNAKTVQGITSTLQDSNVTSPTTLVSVLGRLFGANISIVLHETTSIINRSVDGVASPKKMVMFHNILTKQNFSDYMVSMRKDVDMYRDVPFVELIQMVYKGMDACDNDSKYCEKLDSGSMCSEESGMFGTTCSCKTGFVFNASECININECETVKSLCDQNANCHDTPGGYVCECKEGLSGNGTVCEDACSTSKCPSDSNCMNIDTGAKCNCKSREQFFNKEKNICESGKAVIKLLEMKFNLNYDPLFANKTSKKFAEMARKLEDTLLPVLKKNNNKVMGVRVVDIRQGSIIVDADVIFDSKQSDEQRNSLKEYLSNEGKTELSNLNPSSDFGATVSDGNDCNTNNNPCQTHQSCHTTGALTYQCTCVHGYEMKNGKCQKEKEEEEDPDNVVKIAVPIVVIVLVLMFAICVWCNCRKNRRRQKGRFTDTGYHQPIDNPAYDTKE